MLMLADNTLYHIVNSYATYKNKWIVFKQMLHLSWNSLFESYDMARRIFLGSNRDYLKNHGLFIDNLYFPYNVYIYWLSALSITLSVVISVVLKAVHVSTRLLSLLSKKVTVRLQSVNGLRSRQCLVNLSNLSQTFLSFAGFIEVWCFSNKNE